MQWILCAMTSERICIDQIPDSPSQSVVQQMWLPLQCMCSFNLLCSVLAISFVRLVVGATVLAGGVAVFLAGGVALLLAVGVTVLLAVSMAILPAGGVTVLLVVGVAVLLAEGVAVLLAVGMLYACPTPLTATTLMMYLVPLCSPVKL